MTMTLTEPKVQPDARVHGALKEWAALSHSLLTFLCFTGKEWNAQKTFV